MRMPDPVHAGSVLWPPRWQRGAGLAAALAFCLMYSVSARAQTPSPLQEWQYPGGVILRKEFAPNLPDWQFVTGVGTAVKPLSDGANSYHFQVGPAVDIRYRDLAFASVGEGLGVNVLRGDNYRAGIALTYDLGRSVGDYPSHLSGLGDIHPAPAIKLFGAYVVSKAFPLVLRADARRIIGGADGWVGDLSAYMPLPGSSKKLAMFAGPSLTFADASYMQTEFGVSGSQSLFSGYPRYDAHAGLKAAGFGVSATWFFADHWLMSIDTAADRLLGSAVESPITQERTQGVVALSVAYHW
jgi:outer membrane scaffolding protein for murein synthesis (MipA/OmpV family)